MDGKISSKKKKVRSSHGEEVLFDWKVAERPFRKRDKKHFTNFVIVVLLVSVVLIFIQQTSFMVVIWAGLFLYYVLSTVEPRQVRHKLTTQGIVSGSHSYLWTEMGSFWFEEKNGDFVLHISVFYFPWRLSFLLDKQDKGKTEDVLVQFLPYREVVEEGKVEKLMDWVSARFFS